MRHFRTGPGTNRYWVLMRWPTSDREASQWVGFSFFQYVISSSYFIRFPCFPVIIYPPPPPPMSSVSQQHGVVCLISVCLLTLRMCRLYLGTFFAWLGLCVEEEAPKSEDWRGSSSGWWHYCITIYNENKELCVTNWEHVSGMCSKCVSCSLTLSALSRWKRCVAHSFYFRQF